MAASIYIYYTIFHRIENLNLEGNKLGDITINTLCENLRAHAHLKFLNLSDNNISDAAVEGIVNVINDSDVMIALSLHWNNIK